MSARENLWERVDDYLIDALVGEDPALIATRQSSARTASPGIEVTANQGKLLALLATLIGAWRVLEFGTLVGYSTIWLARAVGPSGTVVSLELEPRHAELARQNLTRAGVGERVEVIVGPAGDSAEALVADRAEPFDLVFIDADKPSNPRYLAATLALTRPGSLIVCDNVVRGGAVIDPDSCDPAVQGTRTLIERIAAEPRLEATALQTVGGKGWDGFVLARVVPPPEPPTRAARHRPTD